VLWERRSDVEEEIAVEEVEASAGNKEGSGRGVVEVLVYLLSRTERARASGRLEMSECN
jgi:hypothetical protein